MARKVDTRLVNRRLNLDGSGGDSYYRETPAEKRTFSPLFVLALAVVFVAGAGATFLLTHEKTDLSAMFNLRSDNFASAADAACMGNGPAPDLGCYLNTQTERLCDPRERRHLRRLTDIYMAQWAANQGAADPNAVALAKASPQERRIMLMAQSMAGPDGVTFRQHGPNGAEQSAADMARTAFSQGSTARPDLAWRQVQMSEGEIVAKFRVLARRGLIAEADFGWSPSETIKKAFVDLGPVSGGCR